MIGAPAK